VVGDLGGFAYKIYRGFIHDHWEMDGKLKLAGFDQLSRDL